MRERPTAVQFLLHIERSHVTIPEMRSTSDGRKTTPMQKSTTCFFRNFATATFRHRNRLSYRHRELYHHSFLLSFTPHLFVKHIHIRRDKNMACLVYRFNMPKGGGGMGSTACVKDRPRFPDNPFSGNEADGSDSDFQTQAKKIKKNHPGETAAPAPGNTEPSKTRSAGIWYTCRRFRIPEKTTSAIVRRGNGKPAARRKWSLLIQLY